MTAKLPAAVLSSLVLALAACGGDDEEPQQPPTRDPGGGGEASEKVVMRNTEFHPASLTVDQGTTVTWINDDSVGHDVTKTVGPGPRFSSGEPGGMQKGDTFEHTFDSTGSFKYVCTVHPGMEGTVTVR